MSTLDDKLREILDYSNGWVVNDHLIADIKRAFAEAGYMTGQEFYDTYEREKGQGSLDNLKDYPRSQDYIDGIDHAVIKCDEAAKRAAELEPLL